MQLEILTCLMEVKIIFIEQFSDAINASTVTFPDDYRLFSHV